MLTFQAGSGPTSSLRTRLDSIDILRGGVMAIMALDHVRDFFHIDAASFSPTNLDRAWPALFLTRWITHFCLPVFMLTAGFGIGIRWQRRNFARAPLARFLISRGVWFLLLELTLMQFAYNFNLAGGQLVLLLILWIFGLCMLAMAPLIYLPVPVLAVFSVAVCLLHNMLDGIDPARFGHMAWLWNLVHQPGVIMVAGKPVLVTYTLLPWIGVMAGGFCLARLYTLDAARRRRILLALGLIAVAAFFVLRLINHYGDPTPWSAQRTPVLSVLSFLNCTKYPGSLDFLLMTLGPTLIALAALDRVSLRSTHPLIVFGRVPMFYFVLHFYAIHMLLVLMSYLRYGGRASRFAFHPPPSMGGPPQLYPAGLGYSLSTVYVVTICLVAALYPVCRWYARFKGTHAYWWLSYL
jgi:uncharacterized membrane protein